MSDKVITASKARPICGVIMPISALDGCAASHWVDVLEILSETIEEAGFEPNLVSNAEEVTFIHKTIIQNVYDNPIVVCDVSGKNPNVMFELGMRLAFDKPTIVVKDDKTTYSFDTSAIEHLEYPRDLRFNTIVEFRQKLREKIKATHAKATTDPAYTTFLKHFGEFTVAKLDKKEVPSQEYILEELRNIRLQLNTVQVRSTPNIARASGSGLGRPRLRRTGGEEIDVCLKDVKADLEKLAEKVLRHPQVTALTFEERKDHKHLIAQVLPEFTSENEKEIVRICKHYIPRDNSGVSH